MAVFAGAACRCSLGAASHGAPPSRALLRRIGLLSHCRDPRSKWSRHVAALRAQSELRAEHAAWAAAAALAVPAASLRGLKCGRLRSLHTFSTRNRSGPRFAFAMFAGFGFVVRFLMLRQAQQSSRRHLN